MTQTNDAGMIKIVIHSPSQHIEDDNERMNESKWRWNGLLFMKMIGGFLFIAVIGFAFLQQSNSNKVNDGRDLEAAISRETQRREELESVDNASWICRAVGMHYKWHYGMSNNNKKNVIAEAITDDENQGQPTPPARRKNRKFNQDVRKIDTLDNISMLPQALKRPLENQCEYAGLVARQYLRERAERNQLQHWVEVKKNENNYSVQVFVNDNTYDASAEEITLDENQYCIFSVGMKEFMHDVLGFHMHEVPEVESWENEDGFKRCIVQWQKEGQATFDINELIQRIKQGEVDGVQNGDVQELVESEKEGEKALKPDVSEAKFQQLLDENRVVEVRIVRGMITTKAMDHGRKMEYLAQDKENAEAQMKKIFSVGYSWELQVSRNGRWGRWPEMVNCGRWSIVGNGCDLHCDGSGCDNGLIKSKEVTQIEWEEFVQWVRRYVSEYEVVVSNYRKCT